MMQKIKHGNTIIQYKLIKSKRRKTSQITVTTNGVTVRTPETKTSAETKKMMQQRIQWIFKKQLYFARHKKANFSTKNKLLVLGKEYNICIIPKSTQKIRLTKNTIEFHIPQKRHSIQQLKTQYNSYLEKRANILFPKLAQNIVKKINITPAKINIKQLKARWGSATISGEINLNSNLMKAPKKVIQYVILHELCHHKIKEHSRRFWNLIARHMPEYQIYTRWLDQNSIKII